MCRKNRRCDKVVFVEILGKAKYSSVMTSHNVCVNVFFTSSMTVNTIKPSSGMLIEPSTTSFHTGLNPLFAVESRMMMMMIFNDILHMQEYQMDVHMVLVLNLKPSLGMPKISTLQYGSMTSPRRAP